MESGAGSVVSATIAAAAALSGAIDLDRQRLHRIVVPAGWTNAALSFQTSSDRTMWSDLYDASGEIVVGAGVVTGRRAVLLYPATFFVQIRSGTAAAPVNQAAARADARDGGALMPRIVYACRRGSTLSLDASGFAAGLLSGSPIGTLTDPFAGQGLGTTGLPPSA